MADVLDSFLKLKSYCEKEDFKGWDPYDGLNSKVFNAVPMLNKIAAARLIWIQTFKRCPFNLRRLLLVPKMHNAKGIGLFLQGYCNLYQAVKARPELGARLGSEAELKAHITHLADLLLLMRTPGFSGDAWGYNFPWQCRLEFLFPANEPTIVATSFCATALLSAYDITGDNRYLDSALSAAKFVTDDLHRTDIPGGFLFSYSKLPGNDTIYNASLLGARLLALCYKYSGEREYIDLAKQTVDACCHAQQPDGSWSYGVKAVTAWKDSFHTGYNLDGLSAYRDISGDASVDPYILKGLDFYLQNFFLPDGQPKYYHDTQYPIDIHCPGQLAVTIARLHRYQSHKDTVNKVIHWAIDNMQSSKGYFFYQKKKGLSSKISYMRWSNAFMFAALSYIILEEASTTKK